MTALHHVKNGHSACGVKYENPKAQGARWADVTCTACLAASGRVASEVPHEGGFGEWSHMPSDGHTFYVWRPSDHEIIAHVGNFGETGERIARLIAAAPELYAALVDMILMQPGATKRAHAAIAKAEGR